MVSAVLDASAVLALIGAEPGADTVEEHIGRAAISAVNLHEVVKELLVRGLTEPLIRQILDGLRLDVRAHDSEAAYAGAALHAQTKRYGRGLGDRACMALGLQLDVPVLTADREWRNVEIAGLRLQHVR